jgi:hypothetical protein
VRIGESTEREKEKGAKKRVGKTTTEMRKGTDDNGKLLGYLRNIKT